jgi:hypothetical protein
LAAQQERPELLGAVVVLAVRVVIQLLAPPCASLAEEAVVDG